MENTKTIGEGANLMTISVGMMPALVAVRVEAQIIKLCGPALFSAIQDEKNKTKKRTDEEMGNVIITMLSESLDEEALVNVINTVFTYVSVNGKRCNVDSDFTGRNKDLWVALVFALRVNFADFFPASLFKRVAEKAAALSQPSSPTSNGTLGDQ